MCGIIGIVGYQAPVSKDMLERATQSLAHRGPDDSGTILLRPEPSSAAATRRTEIGLGSRRLAILDLSPLGHQPMHDPESGNWIVYNGEIYNFHEVRRDLEQAGVILRSKSDTEVLLKSYAQWGQKCLDRLRGMFAFAIWDARQHQLFLARDPMGIKPLYYAQTGPYFIFSSEVRTLLGTGLIRRQLDHPGLLNYLTFGSACDPLTLIENVRSLPPGYALIWKEGRLHASPYWDLVGEVGEEAYPHESPSASDVTHDLAQLAPMLEEAVRLQLVSDVPVGVFLSGGIDSSALVSILSRGGIRPSTFSIVFDEAEFSEAEHSRAIARKFGTDHHEITVSPNDVLAAIPDALRAMDLPTMDGVNTYFVSREARRAGARVALSGLGGDEIFGGYASFRTVPRMERFTQFWKNLPSLVRGPLTSTFAALVPENDQNRKLISLARENGRLLHPYFLTRMLFTPAQRDSLFPSQAAVETNAALDFQRALLDRALALDPINRVSYLESRCYMLNTLLRDADCMSMSQGLEVRVPLIDNHLAKSVLSLPGNMKLNHIPKSLLVGALAGSLPDEIVHRPKRGFTLPFESWMRQELRTEIEPVLSAKRISDGPFGGLLNGRQVEQVWRDFLQGKVSWSRPWSLYVLERWGELHA